MKRTIEITYRMTLHESVNVADYELTEDELDELATKVFENSSLPYDAEDVDWEWQSYPKAKDLAQRPPEDYWFETSYGVAATNNYLLVFKSFPFPKDFKIDNKWRDPQNFDPEKVPKEDFDSLPYHCGWFRESFKPIKEIPGIVVKGRSEIDPGFAILNDKLIAILMPLDCKIQKLEGRFQFHYSY